jgi:uncharacterized repeat protein (TIGR02543 family)
LCAAFSSCDDIFGSKPPVTYTVTFVANGASGTVPAMQTVNADTVISLPDKGNLTNAGNIFVGWSENASGTGTIYSVGSSITVTGNMIFYAQWVDGSTPQYTVTFNANGATGGAAPASQTAYSGINITIPGQGTLVYSGKTFGGWNTQSNGGGTNYAAGTAYIVKGNITLYAKWQSEVQYTVTYHANGASGTAPKVQTVDPGTVVTLPDAGSLMYSGRTFAGWNTNAGGTGTSYAEGAEYTVNANVSFYAQWVSEPDAPQGENPPGNTLAEKLAYIANNAGDGTVFDIAVDNNVYMGPATVSTLGRNITVIIRSTSSADVKTIQLESVGHLFSVDNNITLKLQNIVLRGISMNNNALVLVGQGGKLMLDSASKVTLNTNVSSYNNNTWGGGIYVNGGVLEMYDGAEIIGNKLTGNNDGGGIYVRNNGSVIIYGGIISENRVEYRSCWGGGICINNSTVIMRGGTISKNYAQRGGGIDISLNSSFTKRAAAGSVTSGIIYGGIGTEANTATNSGHAIYRDFGTLKSRNSTIGYYDEISSGNDVGWE